MRNKSVCFRVAALSTLMFVWVFGVGANSRAQSKPSFDFILHNDLSEAEVAHLRAALRTSRPIVLAALGLEEMPLVTIQIWRNETAYQDAMEQTLGMRAPGSRGYVTGDSEIRLLFHRQLSAQREAVHEFVHAATLNLNPEFGNNPRWLWEAAAQYLAEEFVDPRTTEQFSGNQCPSLETLNSPFDRGGAIYRSGYLLGEFISSEWGADSLPALIISNGDIEAVLQVSEREFQGRWCRFVQDKYLQQP